jgi:3-oxoacyl-[acyl-carrier protein] reductase
MDLGIAGRKAIVCASSRGLGKACVRALAEAGCEVVMNGRNAGTLEAAAAEIAKATGAKIITVAADVSTPEGQKALLAACPAPDILINNNAGPPLRDFRELTRQQIIDGVIANMAVAIELIQKAVDPMMRRRFGRIVNITSAAVKAPIDVLGLSNGARTGLTGFVAGLSRKTVRDNVTINALLPGPFATDRLFTVSANQAKAAGITADEIMKKRASENPAGRFGDPEEFGLACAFLCGARAGYITGQNILLDGGAFPGTM